MERNGVSYLPNDSSTERLSGMTEKSSTGAPSGQGDAPGDAPPAVNDLLRMLLCKGYSLVYPSIG